MKSLTIKDVNDSIFNCQTLVAKYEGEAKKVEASALEKRARAYLVAETSTREATRLIQKAEEDFKKAKDSANKAVFFMKEMGGWMTLEMNMSIAQELKDFHIVSADADEQDWRKAMLDMQNEINRMLKAGQTLREVLNSAIPAPDDDVSAKSEASELEALFIKLNAEKDPAKKEEIRRQIDSRTAVAIG